tara:strand:- start:30353 stop:30898 length:546 start_codon:yes stop_codon:yes gene_type:complete
MSPSLNLKNGMHKLKLIFYYLFIQKLPHSRLWGGFNSIRRSYVSKVLQIMPNDSNSKFENGVYISDARKLQIGNYVRINEHVFLQGEISIGNYVMIAPYTAIYTNAHEHRDSTTPMVQQGDTATQKVTIGNNVWLGRNVVVLPGITVGEGAIVGANSVVTKDVAPFTVVGGVPAKLIKNRT